MDRQITPFTDPGCNINEVSPMSAIPVANRTSNINNVKPNIVAIPTIHSHHQDHIQVFNACVAALRPMRSPVPEMVISYEAPEHSRWSTNGIFVPNFFVNIDKFLNNKIKAFYKYKSQVRVSHRDKDTIRAQAEYRGKETGMKVSEAYVLHRFII